MATKNDKAGTDVSVPLMSSADLELLNLTPEGIEAFMNDLGLSAEQVEFEASSFTVTDKADLVDVPLFFVQWRFSNSTEYGGDFAIIHAVRADDGTKVIITDGGTGICEQLRVVTTKREEAGLNELQSHAGLAVKNGLVRSDYPAHINAQGEDIPAGTTYYLG